MDVTALHSSGGGRVRGACVEEQPVGLGKGQAPVSWEKHQE